MKKNYDVIIVGGGLMASSVAYQLLQDGYTGAIAIFEKDRQYEYSSTPRSEGGIRQTFSTEVNIKMSRYSFQVYKNFEKDMALDGQEASIDFKQDGYFYLFNDKTFPMYEEILRLQRKLGVHAEVLDKQSLHHIIPELNIDDLAGGVFDRDAGNIDAYSVLQLYAKNARRLGAQYIHEEVASVLTDRNGVTGIETVTGDTYHAPFVINAAGAWAPALSEKIGIDIPVKPLKKQAFLIDTAKPFEKVLPFTFDPTGAHFRSEGPKVIAGMGETKTFGYNLKLKRSYFEQEIWPVIANRIPNFEQLKVESGWAGLYDYNYIDQNAIISDHPQMKGYYVITGFSGHGFQQAPAVGKGVSEFIRLGRYETIDLKPLSLQRFDTKELILETAIF